MRRILIVDDDPELCALLAHMVRRLGHMVREATDGVQGQLLALQWQPDVILLDIMMPVQDGYTTRSNLRQHEYSGHIILMSAFTTGFRVEDIQSYGADKFLAKPIALTTLEQSINVYLNA